MNISAERRHMKRRISDDCSQCDIWTIEIQRLKHDFEEMMKQHTATTETIHRRIDTMLPKWVFGIILGIYLGLAVFNSMQIRSMSVDVGKLETKVSAIKDNVTEVKKNLKVHKGGN